MLVRAMGLPGAVRLPAAGSQQSPSLGVTRWGTSPGPSAIIEPSGPEKPSQHGPPIIHMTRHLCVTWHKLGAVLSC